MRDEHYDPETLIDYLHGEFPPEKDAAIYMHLALCHACRTISRTEMNLIDLLRARAHAEEQDIPSRVIFKVRAQIARRESPWPKGWGVVWGLVSGLAISAALVLVSTFSILSPAKQAFHSQVAISAAYYFDDHTALTNKILPFAQTAVIPMALESSNPMSELSRITNVDYQRLAKRLDRLNPIAILTTQKSIESIVAFLNRGEPI